jgi:hypothetical protein
MSMPNALQAVPPSVSLAVRLELVSLTELSLYPMILRERHVSLYTTIRTWARGDIARVGRRAGVKGVAKPVL